MASFCAVAVGVVALVAVLVAFTFTRVLGLFQIPVEAFAQPLATHPARSLPRGLSPQFDEVT